VRFGRLRCGGELAQPRRGLGWRCSSGKEGDGMEGGKREWWGLRCRLRLHARACACDMEATAGHERHAATLLCTVATTVWLSVRLKWSTTVV
jgi:hypothetical protein